MDKYTKFILTIIAVGIIGINFQLFGGDIISSAHAYNHFNSPKYHWEQNEEIIEMLEYHIE